MANYYTGMLANQGKSLSHHGIKGQKWGVRRFQNPDGSLTPAGRERYGNQQSGEENRKNMHKAYSSYYDKYDGTDPDSFRRKLGKRLDNLKAYVKEAEKIADNETGYSKSVNEYKTKLNTRNSNMNIFKAPKLYNEMLDAQVKTIEIGQKYEALLNNISMEYINDNFTGDDKIAAQAYVYMMLGYDW